jgi:hypothetical protein
MGRRHNGAAHAGRGEGEAALTNQGRGMQTRIDIFDKPIERIKQTCDLMGLHDDFERKLPELETHLEGLVADGEISEERLAVSGLSFVKQAP